MTDSRTEKWKMVGNIYIAIDTYVVSGDTLSTQVNVRLDDTLLSEIDSISKVLHVSRTEWLRMKIALAVKDDTLKLSEAITLEYAKGRISEKELRNLLGSDADEIMYIVKHMTRGKSYIEEMVNKGIL